MISPPIVIISRLMKKPTKYAKQKQFQYDKCIPLMTQNNIRIGSFID